MKDPIEIEQQANDWLRDAAKIAAWALACIASLLAPAAFLLFLAGCFGAMIGMVIRAAKWTMGS